MSNLGKVYELNFKNGTKQVYPVVYENKSRYYCKKYGCDELAYFRKREEGTLYTYTWTVYPYEKYLELNDKFKREKGFVYVYIGPHDNQTFEELRECTFNYQLEHLKKMASVKQNTIEKMKIELDNMPDKIKAVENERDEILSKVEALEKNLTEKNLTETVEAEND